MEHWKSKSMGALYQPDGSTCTNWRKFYSNLVPLVFGQCFDLLHDLEDGLLLETPGHHLNGQRHSHGALRGFSHPFHKLPKCSFKIWQWLHLCEHLPSHLREDHPAFDHLGHWPCPLERKISLWMRWCWHQGKLHYLTRYNACRHIKQIPCYVGLD